MLHIEFTTDLGARVTVDVENPAQLLDIQRQYGRLGWTSGDVPSGGYQFPLENEADFDWTLIGARKWTSPDGEELVIHRGHAYRRRELDAVDSRKMKLPAAVKYSRGAKSTDPDHVREKSDGEFEYVTLAIFRGGKRQERYATPRQGTQPTQASRPAPQAAAPGTRPAAQQAPQQAARPAPRPAPAPAPTDDETPF
ncbi:hypothetical protein GCM10008959_35820 [Deinococcus seoulensis]|uniref:Single-stranded DNA-binding protein n=1 Tax=Deinococcus seoulensis TaxID=1837379 RepID=A0ABQ2RVH1_9DEIO|nr:single-stranded DNA-binding protein [Deinococcus seoulensis]GGR70912.1 hypothetical protein GCM10008959_35820 [Deinococcus seoulensis]